MLNIKTPLDPVLCQKLKHRTTPVITVPGSDGIHSLNAMKDDMFEAS